MQIQTSTPQIAPRYQGTQPAPEAQLPTDEPVVIVGDDGYQPSRKDRSEIGWLDVGKGMVGAVAGAAIQTVGNTASAAVQGVELTGRSWAALATNETHGPWVKTGMGLLAPFAAGLGVAVTAVGSMGYGLYAGFVDGIHNGVSGSVKGAVDSVKTFNTELVAGAREGIREFGNAKLRDGEERFDVSPARAAVGVAAGVGNAAYGAVRAGWTTGKNVPGAFRVGNLAISKSEMSTPLKAASHVMSVPLAVVATPIGAVVGGAAGLIFGAHAGYNEGFVESFKQVNDFANFYDEKASKLLKDTADDLINR